MDSSWHTDLGKRPQLQPPGLSASAFGLWHAGGGNLHQIRGSSFSTCCLCFSPKILEANSWMTDDGKKVELLMEVLVFYVDFCKKCSGIRVLFFEFVLFFELFFVRHPFTLRLLYV